MRVSFSIEVVRGIRTKRLGKQLEKVNDLYLQQMELAAVTPIMMDPPVTKRGTFDPGDLSVEATLQTHPPVQIPVLTEEEAIKKRNRHEAGVKAAQTRKKNLAKVARLAKKKLVK